MKLFDIAVVLTTVCRDSLLRAAQSVFDQSFPGRVQLLIGVDVDPQRRLPEMQALLDACCPPNMLVTWLALPYSTSARHGGIHEGHFGGSLRSALSLLAHSEIVMYLDDDDWFHPSHIADILAAIDGVSWAHARCIYADGNTSQGLCEDLLESVGVGKGYYREINGGFVRPSGLAINKLAHLRMLHRWSMSPFPTGDGEDRLIFSRLKDHPHRDTGKATVFYSLDPRDDMHAMRLHYMALKGVTFSSSEKLGSVRNPTNGR